MGAAYVMVDGATADRTVVVEAYARQGLLKGAQPKKVAQDILKLALIKRETNYASAHAIIAFGSTEAHDSIAGWLRRAAESFGVELRVVTLDPTWQTAILLAQAQQMMVNQGDLTE